MGNSFGPGESESQRAAVQLLTGVVNERRFEQVRRFQAGATSLPKEWQDVARSDDFTFWATPAETEELGRRIFELLAPFQARTLAGERPEASRLVQWLLYAFPLPAGPERADHA